MTARHRLRIALVLTAACLLAVLSYFILSSSHRTGEHTSSPQGVPAGCVGDAIVIKGFRQTVAEGARTIYELWANKATLKIDTKQYSLERVLPASTYFGENGRGHIRLTFVSEPEQRIAEGLRRLASYVHERSGRGA